MISIVLLEKIGKFVLSEIENQPEEFEEDENIPFIELLFSRMQGDK